jgi:DNA-binding NarL/FixJ family response regulator
MTKAARLRPTVLVVEDEFIIALDVAETVKDIGYIVEGPYGDQRSAFLAIEQDMPDAAILDVSLLDGEVYPLADALALAGVPMIFHSDHVDSREINARYPDAVTCSKPCPPGTIISALHNVIEYRIKAGT